MGRWQGCSVRVAELLFGSPAPGLARCLFKLVALLARQLIEASLVGILVRSSVWIAVPAVTKRRHLIGRRLPLVVERRGVEIVKRRGVDWSWEVASWWSVTSPASDAYDHPDAVCLHPDLRRQYERNDTNQQHLHLSHLSFLRCNKSDKYHTFLPLSQVRGDNQLENPELLW